MVMVLSSNMQNAGAPGGMMIIYCKKEDLEQKEKVKNKPKQVNKNSKNCLKESKK